MWNPISLKISNLFSHENSSFDFINNQTTTISGINKTDSNVQSNGSGKTSILDCISIALMGEPLRDISKKEIVRNGEKGGECELVLKNNILNKILKIKREINSTKSNNALVWINDSLDNNLKDLSPSETDKYILSLLGISKDDLRNYFLISKDSYQSFFLNGDVAKKEIINRFSKANMIDPVDPLIKGDLSLLDIALQDFFNQKKSNEGVLLHLEEEISKEKLDSSIDKTRELIVNNLKNKIEDLEKLKNNIPELRVDHEKKMVESSAKITSLKESLESIENSINCYSLDISTYNNKIKVEDSKQIEIESEFKTQIGPTNKEIAEKELEFQEKINANKAKTNDLDLLYESLFKDINDETNNFELEIVECKKNIKEQDQIIGEIEKNIADKINCPKCDHSFILRDKDYDLEAASKELVSAKEIKSETNSLIEEINLSIKELNNKKIQLKEKKEIALSDILKEKNNFTDAFNSDILILNDKIKFLKNEQLKKENEIDEIKKSIKKSLQELESKIFTCQKDKKDKHSSLNQEEINYNKLSAEYIELDEKSSLYDTQIDLLNKSIIEERNREYEDKTTSLKNKIDILLAQNVELQVQIDEIEEDKSQLLEWQARFKQFKSFMANTSISAIEDMTNFFLGKMKTNLTVSIDGYRELSSGKLKEEITTLVCRDGLNGESFSKFSGGERAKVDLAMILAMQKIINISSENGGLNLIFIDEILESVDELALTGVIKALSQLEQTILIITHVSQNSFECNKIQVEKVNGISNIKI